MSVLLIFSTTWIFARSVPFACLLHSPLQFSVRCLVDEHNTIVLFFIVQCSFVGLLRSLLVVLFLCRLNARAITSYRYACGYPENCILFTRYCKWPVITSSSRCFGNFRRIWRTHFHFFRVCWEVVDDVTWLHIFHVVFVKYFPLTVCDSPIQIFMSSMDSRLSLYLLP